MIDQFVCNSCRKPKRNELLAKIRAPGRKICSACWEAIQKAKKLRGLQ